MTDLHTEMAALGLDKAFLERYAEEWTGLDRDIYTETYSPLRAESPIWHGDLAWARILVMVGFEAESIYTMFRYDDCDTILRHPATSVAINEPWTSMVLGRTILCMDDPEHREQRALGAHAFRPSALKKWDSVIDDVIDELLAKVVAGGNTDLTSFTFAIPSQVVAAILGLPRADYPKFQRWTLELTGLPIDAERGVAASLALREYFAEIVRQRRLEPKDDLISDLLVAEHEGVRLEDEEIYSFLRLLLMAGIETTFRSMGSLLLLLLQHPDQLDAVRSDRSLIKQAIEEQLRLETPVQSIVRSMSEDLELRDVRIPAGSPIVVSLGSANHDPERWERPDEFDIFRPYKPHLAFATGPHTCLGLHLARLESRVALDKVLDRLGDLHLDKEAGESYMRGRVLRAPNQIPVRFHPVP